MGLLKHVLFWPVTGPSYLTRFSLERVGDAVRTELTDDTGVKERLMELQMQLEQGDVSEVEYLEREAELMRALRSTREWQERYGMPTSGGLVRVAGSGDAAATEGSEGGSGEGGGDAGNGPVREQIYGSLTEKQQGGLEKIVSASQHLLDLVNDILDLSKIEPGRCRCTSRRCR